MKASVLLFVLLITGCSLSVNSGQYACDESTADKRLAYYEQCTVEKGLPVAQCKNTAEWLYCKHGGRPGDTNASN